MRLFGCVEIRSSGSLEDLEIAYREVDPSNKTFTGRVYPRNPHYSLEQLKRHFSLRQEEWLGVEATLTQGHSATLPVAWHEIGEPAEGHVDVNGS